MSVYNRRTSSVNLNQLVTNIPTRRKAPDQVQRDKFEWDQWQSATKAINNVESPAKEKHVRNLILGTFRIEGAQLFWTMMTRLQLESHPIVCWKFCYVIHRVLRDGHKNVINDSISLTAYFEQLGKFWSALKQSYGTMTHRYCQLMISKLTFHQRNPTFPGNLMIGEQNDIRRLFNDNLDAYFQLCIELMDYLEGILSLVECVFTSLDQSRANSMTTSGQCRLHPLILCVQDSSLLYDYIVKVLFKLHDSLPGDTLQGHRQRLIEQFRRLKRFYDQASTLQYFKDLIKVPTLPDNPPNFKLKEDQRNYQTAVAIVHEPPPESSQTEDILIDTADDTLSTISFPMEDPWSSNGHFPDRSAEIAQLEQRIANYESNLRGNQMEIDELRRLIAMKEKDLTTEKNQRLQLEEQLRQQLENQKRIEEMHALEKKSNSDEKFNKLLETYNKLREEHIVVLRREGELKKQFANLNQEHNQLKETNQKIINELQQLKTEYEQLKIKNENEVQQEILQLRQTNDEIHADLSFIKSERDLLIEQINQQKEELHVTVEQRKTFEEMIDNLRKELNEINRNFDQEKQMLVESKENENLLQKSLIEITENLHESQSKARENEEKFKEIEKNLQRKTKELNETIVDLQDQLEQSKKENQNLLSMTDQLKTVSSTNDVRMMKLNEIIEQQKLTNESLVNQLTQANRERDHLREQNSFIEKREIELQERIQALTNERNDFQTTALTTSEKIKAIELAKQSVEERFHQSENERSNMKNQFEYEKSDYENQLRDIRAERDDLFQKNRENQESLMDLLHEKEELEHKVADLAAETREWAQKFVQTTDNQKSMQTNFSSLMNNLKQQYQYSILTYCINLMHDGVERAKDVELLNCKSGAEYLLGKLRAAVSSAKITQELWPKHVKTDESATMPFLNECITLATTMVDIVVHGKATSNLIQDVDQGNLLADQCREVILQCIDLYSNYQTPTSSTDSTKQSEDLIRRLNALIQKTTTLLPKVADISKEELGDIVEKELQLTHNTIDEAVRQLEAMMMKSREQDTGIKLQVNGQILDSCGKLMQTIKILIIRARDLQKEIVSQGRGTATAREFYTKNHKWTEGLVSAAKNVGLNAKVLIERSSTFLDDNDEKFESADHLLDGSGKFEEIIVCSQEIAASTAQLVAASNVKADRGSKNREALSQASKEVNTSTAQVVATAKNCASIVDEKGDTDFTSLTLHQTKKKEMEVQVKVLELEKALEQAKQHLYSLRKQHYQMAGEDAGWDQSDANSKAQH